MRRKPLRLGRAFLGTNWERVRVYVGIVSLVRKPSSAHDSVEDGMAHVGRRGNRFHIIFRHGGRRPGAWDAGPAAPRERSGVAGGGGQADDELGARTRAVAPGRHAAAMRLDQGFHQR